MENLRSLPWYRRLHWQILIAMLGGTLTGLLGGETVVPLVGWLGTVFIKLLKMIILPLILTSIVSGVTSVGGGRSLGRLFGKTLGYYVLSSALAIFAGLAAVNLIRPGVGATLGGAEQMTVPEVSAPSSPVDLLLDIVPDNVLAAAAEADMLAVIFFSILLGMSIAALPDKPRGILVELFESGFQAMMKLTGGIIRFAPIGVFGLITRVVGTTGLESFHALGLYMITIALGLTVHLLVTLPLLLLLLGRIRPVIHFRNMTEPLAMAFSTSSSGATLPVTLNAVENRVGVSNRISSFVFPWGRRSTWTARLSTSALECCSLPRYWVWSCRWVSSWWWC